MSSQVVGELPFRLACGAELCSRAGCSVFPPENAWNLDVSALPVHRDSDTFIDSIGRADHVHPDFGTEWDGAPIGIPFITVDASQPDVPIVFTAW